MAFLLSITYIYGCDAPSFLDEERVASTAYQMKNVDLDTTDGYRNSPELSCMDYDPDQVVESYDDKVYDVTLDKTYFYLKVGFCAKVPLTASIGDTITVSGRDEQVFLRAKNIVPESWTYSDDTGLHIDANNIMKALKPGVYDVSMNFSDANNVGSGMQVVVGSTQETLRVCGLGYDDPRISIIEIDCLKVASLKNGRLFTAMVPENTLNFLNFMLEEAGGDIGTNDGRTYRESNSSGLSSVTSVGFFDSKKYQGVTQGQRWCDDLSRQNFEGKSNWELPTVAQFQDLLSEKGSMTLQGWDAFLGYMTQPIYVSNGEERYDYVFLGTGFTGNVHPASIKSKANVSCTSSP